MEVTSVKVFSDSQLVVSQVHGMYLAKGLTMVIYLKKARELIARFEVVNFQKLPKEENSHADALVNVASNVHVNGK